MAFTRKGLVATLEQSLAQSLSKETRDEMRRMGLSLNGMFGELGLDTEDMEGMARDPVSTVRALDGPETPDVSVDDARGQTEPMRTKILELYGTLGDIVARREATIQKRWSKKTKSQRLAVLLQARPTCPVSTTPTSTHSKTSTA